MSDTEQPTNPPVPPPAESAAQDQVKPPEVKLPSARPQPGGRRPFQGGRPGKPPRERPEFKPGPAPNLEGEYRASAPSLRDLDKEIEQDLEAAMGGMSATDMYGDLSQKPAKTPAGEPGPKKGKVIRVHGADVFVQVPGGRSEGLLSMTQFPEGPPAVGTEVDIHIEGYDPSNGLLILTRKGAAVQADWASVTEGMIVEARVTGTNKGGLEVDVNGIRGFLPISQIDLYRVEDTNQFINQRLLCMVSEVNPAERNLIVSRRALLEKERDENREKLWNELAEGQIREGIVRSVKDFGAFVDLGGADGLLHVSEMSWSRVADAAAVVQPGQKLKVVVLKIDRERRKLSLGLKQLQASPWDSIGEKYHTGAVVAGKVTRLMDFGAFVELEPGVEGLIHISELAPRRVHRVSDIVQAGQDVQVKVLLVDPAQRRISLSLKAALPEEVPTETEEEDEEPVEVKPPKPRTTPLRGGIGDG